MQSKRESEGGGRRREYCPQALLGPTQMSRAKVKGEGGGQRWRVDCQGGRSEWGAQPAGLPYTN